MKWILRVFVALLAVYLAVLGVMLAAMFQPPELFARVMSTVVESRILAPLFLVMPFQRLWFIAREGSLKPGDVAPDFELQSMDRKSSIRLSAFRGQKPVVLIFGSYT